MKEQMKELQKLKGVREVLSRRTQARKKVELPCIFAGLLHGKQTYEMAHVTDLSLQGMYVEANDPLDEGTEMNAKIKDIPFGEIFLIMGKVLRSTTNGMAIRFADYVPKEIEIILNTRWNSGDAKSREKDLSEVANIARQALWLCLLFMHLSNSNPQFWQLPITETK